MAQTEPCHQRFGEKGWRGGNASAVKVPGTDKDVIVGDYFQWAAHEGYCESGDRGLLIYNGFSNRACGDNMDHFSFKNVGEYLNSYQFNTVGRRSTVGISPYYVNGYTKYNSIDKRKTLEASDDVARIILGGSWRMPSSAEFQAMKDATYWAWDAKDGGYYVYTPQEGDAGKTDEGAAHTYDKSKALLFFPAAGNGFNTYLDGAGSNGRYWSSTLSDPEAPTRAQSLCFSANDVSPQNGNDRYLGYCVRPVSN